MVCTHSASKTQMSTSAQPENGPSALTEFKWGPRQSKYYATILPRVCGTNIMFSHVMSRMLLSVCIHISGLSDLVTP